MRRILIGLALAALVLAGAVWLLLQAPFLDGWRARVVADALSDALGRPVAIEGPLRVYPARHATIDLAGLSIDNPAWAEADHLLTVGRASLAFSPCVVLGCPFEIRDVRLYDVASSFEVRADGAASWGRGSARAGRAPFPRGVLTAITEADAVSIDFVTRQTGWRFAFRLDRWSTVDDGGGRRTAADGTLNGEPFTLTATTGREAGGGPFRSVVAFEAADTRVTIDTSTPDRRFRRDLDVTLAADVPSLARLLAVLDLAPARDARGELEASLAGDLSDLALTAGRAALAGPGGGGLTVTGSAGNVWTLEGSDFAVDGVLVPPGASRPARNLFDLRLTGFSARLRGDPNDLAVEDLQLSTNAVDLAFREIGPVELARLRRDPTGRLMLPHYRIVAGPRHAPLVAAEGRIGDVLVLGDWTAAGTVDVAASALIDSTRPDALSGLGRFEGRFELSDEGGATTLHTLDGRVVGTDLLALDLSLVPVPASDAHAATIDLAVPDAGSLAAAAGLPPVEIRALSFAGRVTAGTRSLATLFEADVDGMAIVGRLTLGEVARRTRLSGTVSIPVLSVDELVRIGVSLGRLLGTDEAVERLADARDLAVALLDAEVAILSDRISGGGATANDFRAEIDLADGELSAPVSLRFLGGTLESTLAMSLADLARPGRLTGTIDDLDLAGLLPETLVGLPVAGRISARYDLGAVMESTERLLRTLDGDLTVAVPEGRIGTNMIEAAGMGFMSFMFSRAALQQHSDIRCGVFSVRFRDGVGTIEDGVLETAFTHASLNGRIDLGADAVELLIEPRPIDRPEAHSYVPVRVTGSLASPDVALAGSEFRKPKAQRRPVGPQDEARAAARARACRTVAEDLR